MTHFLKVSLWTHWFQYILSISVRCIIIVIDVPVPTFGQYEPLQAGSSVLLTWPWNLYFLTLRYDEALRVRLAHVLPTSQSQMFIQGPGSFHCEMTFGEHSLSTQGITATGLLTGFRCLQWAEEQMGIFRKESIHHKFMLLLYILNSGPQNVHWTSLVLFPPR